MCDQIVALMSSKHSQSISIWSDSEDDDNDCSDEDDEESRIMKCVVDKTTELKESIQVREGFKACVPNFPTNQSCKLHHLGSLRAHFPFEIYHR